MQWKDPKNEETQFKIHRVLSYYDFARVLEFCFGGDRLPEIVRGRTKSDFKISAAPWQRKPPYERKGLLVISSASLMYDPAIYLGFPELSEEEKLSSNLLKKAMGEKRLAEIVSKSQSVMDKKQEKSADEVQNMSLPEVSMRIEEILAGDDESLRWKTLWALVMDDRVTRIDMIRRLKYTNPDEVRKDFYPYHFHKNFKESPGWEEELELNVPVAARHILQYRARSMGVEFTEEFLAQQIILDLGKEIDTCGKRILKLAQEKGELEEKSAAYASENRTLSKTIELLEEEKNGLSGKVHALSGQLEAAQKAVIPAPKPTKDEKTSEYLSGRVRQLEAEKNELAAGLENEGKAHSKTKTDLEKKTQLVGNHLELLGLIKLKDFITDYYRNKKIVVLTMQPGDEKYQRVLGTFGINANIIGTSQQRKVEEVLASQYDYVIIATGITEHQTTYQAPQEKTILLPRGVSKLPEVLLNAIPLDRMQEPKP